MPPTTATKSSPAHFDWRSVQNDKLIKRLNDAFMQFQSNNSIGAHQIGSITSRLLTKFDPATAKLIVQKYLRVKPQQAERYLAWGRYYDVCNSLAIWKAVGYRGLKQLSTASAEARATLIPHILTMSKDCEKKFGSPFVGDCYVARQLTKIGEAPAAQANECAPCDSKKPLPVDVKKALTEFASLLALNPSIERDISTTTVELLKQF